MSGQPPLSVIERVPYNYGDGIQTIPTVCRLRQPEPHHDWLAAEFSSWNAADLSPGTARRLCAHSQEPVETRTALDFSSARPRFKH